MRTFKQLFYADPRTWKQEELEELSAKQLQVFLKLLGTSSSGKKAILIERILKTIQIRHAIAFYKLHPECLTSNYTKKRLQEMCKDVGIWKGKNKYQAAVSLCNWAKDCRQKGQRFLKKCIEDIEKQPRQLTLNLGA